MNNSAFSWDRFKAIPIIGILRGVSFEKIKKIIPIYVSSGLTTIEITMNSPSAGETIRFLTEQYADCLNIGAGTVCSLPDLDMALEANAQFIVTPIVQEPIIKRCKGLGIPIFPGAFTPTEIFRAWELGASMVKIYPAGVLGPAYIRDLKAPLNQLKVVPTGGINGENMSLFMEAGADGLGIGSGIFGKKHIESEDWGGLRSNFESFVNYFKAPGPASSESN